MAKKTKGTKPETTEKTVTDEVQEVEKEPVLVFIENGPNDESPGNN